MDEEKLRYILGFGSLIVVLGILGAITKDTSSEQIQRGVGIFGIISVFVMVIIVLNTHAKTLEEEERKIWTKKTIKVFAYLLGAVLLTILTVRFAQQDKKLEIIYLYVGTVAGLLCIKKAKHFPSFDKIHRKRFIWKSGIILLCIAGSVPLCIMGLDWLEKNNQYNEALTYIEKGEYSRAHCILDDISGFKYSKLLDDYCHARIYLPQVTPDAEGKEILDTEIIPYLESLSDDYNGFLCNEIHYWKEYVCSGIYYADIIKKAEEEAKKAEEEAERAAALEAKRAIMMENYRRLYPEEEERSQDKKFVAPHSSYVYIPPTMYTDPEDYDNPEDFADDAWGLDFEDWDEAYDYWEDY